MAQSPPQSDNDPIEEEIFEFSSNSTVSNNMSHAEDIIFCGKLITLQNNNHYCNVINVATVIGEEDREGRGRQYSSKLKNSVTQPNSPTKNLTLMSSKSFDHQQLRRSLSNDCRSAGIRRYSSARTPTRHDNPGPKVGKPRWYSMLFGLASKVPPEMELRDMKNRLVRRTPTTMFAQSDNKITIPTYVNGHKSPWGLLGVLSCKHDASIDVNTSFVSKSHVKSTCDNTYSRATCT